MNVHSPGRWQGVGRAIARSVCFIGAAAVFTPTVADAPQQVHGVGDVYAGPAVALAWGILHGANEASTQVVVRIIADPHVYLAVAAVARNPFSEREQQLLPATPTDAGVDVRVPRSQYADFPRTELRFYDSVTAVGADAPALVVFYLGVPDTTPEFVTEAKLNAYLADRIARARSAGASVGK